MDDFISVKNITKSFGVRLKKPVTALDDVSFDVKKGEIFGLLGPNGAGKTTLIRVLCSLMLPDKGSVHINGRDIVRDENLRNSIGLVLANERSFYWRISGIRNLMFFGSLFNLTGGALKNRIIEVAELLGIEKELNKVFLYYSSGIKQRFNIARALLHNPDILILDDPTRDVDIPAKTKILYFFKEVLNKQQGKTIVFVTHQANEIENFCDKVCIMNKGKVKAVGSVTELKNKTGLDDIKGVFDYYLKEDEQTSV